MATWQPDICAGGQCELEWFAGDNFAPIGAFRFLSVCQAHATAPTDTARLAQLKDENQAMSFARAKLAELIDLRDKDQEYSGDGIGFSFDAQRRIAFAVPGTHTAALARSRGAVNAALAKISPRIRSL